MIFDGKKSVQCQSVVFYRPDFKDNCYKFGHVIAVKLLYELFY